jgi:hypothetical protein
MFFYSSFAIISFDLNQIIKLTDMIKLMTQVLSFYITRKSTNTNKITDENIL